MATKLLKQRLKKLEGISLRGPLPGTLSLAAAGDAARKKLEPTVKELQKSALRLVHRMIEAKEKAA